MSNSIFSNNVTINVQNRYQRARNPEIFNHSRVEIKIGMFSP